MAGSRAAVIYREHPPAVPALRGVVDAFWTLTHVAPAPPDAGTVLPDGSIEVVLSLGDPVRPSATARPLSRFVVGQMERPWRVVYTGVVKLVGIRLHPAAARTLLRMPMDRLANRVVALGSIAPELDAALRLPMEGGLKPAPPAARVERVSRVLLAFLAAGPPADPLVRAAADAIRARRGQARIGALAAHLGLSARQFERRFRREVGLSPKRWCRVVRFQAAARTMPEGEDGWADLAAHLGYADQAHLVREFGEFAGVPPTRAWWSGGRRVSSRRRRPGPVI